ncbi:serine-rich adhesin for platelets isoform X2 [Micropterus dolomieu]|uniref:serine-rich adhesin for platelets isoform X2 n=1 Tax=Micropterus dolomieu TaxID=147949 RepID=UPI001E8E846E|nr:serine-rich adhesin for platelets isoform X2 [Micropterus dolomieu]
MLWILPTGSSLMFDEDEVMKAPDLSYVRMKKPDSCVRHPQWLCIQLLVVLLAGQASCNQTTAAPPLSLATPNAQTAVCYFLDITVEISGNNKKNESEIKAWLTQVFLNLNCLSPNHAETTVTPTSIQIATTTATTPTVLESSNTTTVGTSTVLESSNTTTAGTSAVLESSNTTTAGTSTVLESSNTTTVGTSTVLESSNTTTAGTSTVLESSNTTTPATSTATTHNTTTATTSTATTHNTTTATTSTATTHNTTTAAASTTVNLSTTTAAASTTVNRRTTTAAASTTVNRRTTTAAASITVNRRTTTAAASTTVNRRTTTAAASTSFKPSITIVRPNSQTVSSPNSNINTQMPGSGGGNNNPPALRIARQIGDSVTQTRGISNNETTGLFQGIKVSCTKNTAITKTNCTVTLQLAESIPPCCILSALSENNNSDIHVVGKKADTTSSLQNVCNSSAQDKNCTSCEESGTTYVAPQINSTYCNAGIEDSNTNTSTNCNCSAYCNGTDAYYTFYVLIKDTNMNYSDVLVLISKLKQPSNCSQSTDVLCSLPIITSEYKDGNVACTRTPTNFQNCSVILDFAHEVPINNVSAAMMSVFQSEKQINYNGQVIRAAICGNSKVSDNSLNSQLIWYTVNLYPVNFCTVMEQDNILNCQNGENVVVLLKEMFVPQLFTTPGPNTLTTQPHNTTLSVNATSSPLNTTALTGITTTANVTTLSTTKPVSTTTESADSQANALLEMTGDVSKLNSSQVDHLVSQLENLLSGPTVSKALGNTSVQIVSNLLGASPETLSRSSNRIIGIVDTVALKLVIGKQVETLLSPAVALSVKPADGNNFQQTFFSISGPNDVQVRGVPRLRRSVTSQIPQGSISLPTSLTQNLTLQEQQLASRVQFNFYQKSTVFQDTSLGARKLNSGILGASVANLSITGLQDDVVIQLRHIEPVPGNFVTVCVFWDYTFNNGSGGWNPKGCFVQNRTEKETVCGCNHLTSFAILLDLSREPIISPVQNTILTFITYIGCGVSAIFLSITLLTYLAFGKLRKDIPSKILIQLCLALLMLNLVFLVDAWLALYPQAVGLCISTAWFLHYFLLVTFTWMGLEAFHMYLALVKVFNSYISRYMVKFSLVGWGVPMIVVIIVIAINKDNYGLVSYGKFTDGTSDDFCWLKNDIAFYVAVVAYFCVIFLFNFVMFIVVLVQLCRIKRQNPHNSHHRTTLHDVRSVVGITFLLGLTWGFAFFAWGPVNLPFMYLFAIFNSFQGLFIFVFHCALKENVRRQWRTYLCCGRLRLAENSEWSRTATQKTVKKSSETRQTPLHSENSNNSSSSSAFLVRDSSQQINGIGSPFADRVITADEEPSTDIVLNEINRQYRTQGP